MNERMLLHEKEYRGQQAIDLIGKCRLVICGAGAVGSLLTDNLIRQGFRQVRVIDFDRVELHNVSTQLYDSADVGAKKVDALRNKIFRGCEVEIDGMSKRLEVKNAARLLKGFELAIDAFDNSESRRIVKETCLESQLDCLHVGLFEGYCETIWNEAYRVPDDVAGDVCEYPQARNLVNLAVTLASEQLIDFVVDGAKRNMSATLKDFSIGEMEMPVFD